MELSEHLWESRQGPWTGEAIQLGRSENTTHGESMGSFRKFSKRAKQNEHSYGKHKKSKRKKFSWLQASDGYLFLLTEREPHVRDSTTLWEWQQTEFPPERYHCSLYPYPSLITTAGSFRMKNTHFPFPCKKASLVHSLSVYKLPAPAVPAAPLAVSQRRQLIRDWVRLAGLARAELQRATLRPVRKAKAFGLL